MSKTKSKIKSAARQLFLEKGFEGTTMRDIAKHASVALGSTYYYFKTKDEIILEFYLEKQDEVENKAEKIIKSSKNFKQGLLAILQLQYEVLADSKSFLHVLARSAIDPENPLSPLNKNTIAIRRKNLDIFSDLIEQSNLKLKPDLKKQFPFLLWGLQMALIYIWINDRSQNYGNTITITKTLVTLTSNLIKLSKIPFGTTIVNNIISLTNKIFKIFPGLTEFNEINAESNL